MCGIVGVVRRRAQRDAPDIAELQQLVAAAEIAFDGFGSIDGRLTGAAEPLERLDAQLRGVPGVRVLIGDPAFAQYLARHLTALEAKFDELELGLDTFTSGALSPAELEAVNAALVRARDAAWAVRRDRLRTARAVTELAGPTRRPPRSRRSSRCRSRSRPSTGSRCAGATPRACTCWCVTTRSISTSPPCNAWSAPGARIRSSDPARCGSSTTARCRSSTRPPPRSASSVTTPQSCARRSAPTSCSRALAGDAAEVVVLGHTRWASVGIISEANAHPLNQEEVGRVDGPYVVGALNGDVDNYADLNALEGLHSPAEITTDAKVIPALVARRLEAGLSLADAFRTTVAELEGSLAIGAQAAAEPGTLLLSLRGSGQALYVGLADDAFVVASEPYGLVEEASEYLRLDGETPADPSARPPRAVRS